MFRRVENGRIKILQPKLEITLSLVYLFGNIANGSGADTTAETLTYLTWQISRPGYQHIQEKSREEMKDAGLRFNQNGLPPLRAIDKLPYLKAFINEALRVYPAIPMSEPRVLLDSSKEVSIYGHKIPAGTICSMQLDSYRFPQSR